MPRLMPPDRFAAVVAASTHVFVTHGFRRAQVQDVADVLGVSKGALYGYATGKLALFSAALRYADGADPLPERAGLPVPPPQPGELGAVVSGRLADEVPRLELVAALSREAPPDGVTGPGELGLVVADLYGVLSRHRRAIKLVDRCAPEFGELRTAWFGEGRALQIGGLAELLRRRADAGLVALPADAELVARSVVELCVLWAVHRHWDPAGEGGPGSTDDEDEVRAMLVQMLSRSVTPPPAGPRSRRPAGGTPGVNG